MPMHKADILREDMEADEAERGTCLSSCDHMTYQRHFSELNGDADPSIPWHRASACMLYSVVSLCSDSA
jgi:hypothetical protein